MRKKKSSITFITNPAEWQHRDKNRIVCNPTLLYGREQAFQITQA